MTSPPTSPLLSRRTLLIAAALGWATRAARAGLVDVMARSRGSVVAVGTLRETDSPRFGFRGTGFAVGDGRRVVTCAHVLPETTADAQAVAPALVVQTGPESGTASPWRVATVEAVDRAHDVALLRIEGAPLPALAIDRADAGPVREGSAVALVGFPIGSMLGFVPVIHRGIVSARVPLALAMPTARQLDARTIRALRGGGGDGGASEIYQLDATVLPGNSGGPLVDADSGRVIGVVNMGLVKQTHEAALAGFSTGISYAVPIRHAAALLRGERP